LGRAVMVLSHVVLTMRGQRCRCVRRHSTARST
jgi:hypothetical protein